MGKKNGIGLTLTKEMTLLNNEVDYTVTVIGRGKDKKVSWDYSRLLNIITMGLECGQDVEYITCISSHGGGDEELFVSSEGNCPRSSDDALKHVSR